MAAIIRRRWTVRDRVKASIDPGKPARRIAGGWIADLAALGKAIVLCDFCAHKFEPKAYGYQRRRVIAGYAYVLGDCDGCKRSYMQCGLYLPSKR